MDIEKLIERLYKHHTDWGEGRTQDFFEVCLDCKDAATALPTLPALQAELEQVRRERDAAQSLLAERIGVRGAEPITTAFGLPIDRLCELAQADQEGKIPKYTIGDTIYDRFGDAW